MALTVLFVISLILGFSGLMLCLFFFAKFRIKPLLYYFGFLGALYCIVVKLTVFRFAGGDASGLPFRIFTSSIDAAMSLLFVFCGPLLAHYLAELPPRTWAKRLLLALGAILACGNGISNLFVEPEIGAFLGNLLCIWLPGSYMLAITAIRIRRIAASALRTPILAFFALSLAFFVSRILSPTDAQLRDYALAFYLIPLNLITIWVAFSYFFHPAYSDGTTPSEYFLKLYGISPRESEIIAGILMGRTNSQIAEECFISPKTVENHLGNIYQKTRVNSRLHLYNLIVSNSA